MNVLVSRKIAALALLSFTLLAATSAAAQSGNADPAVRLKQIQREMISRRAREFMQSRQPRGGERSRPPRIEGGPAAAAPSRAFTMAAGRETQLSATALGTNVEANNRATDV